MNENESDIQLQIEEVLFELQRAGWKGTEERKREIKQALSRAKVGDVVEGDLF